MKKIEAKLKASEKKKTLAEIKKKAIAAKKVATAAKKRFDAMEKKLLTAFKQPREKVLVPIICYRERIIKQIVHVTSDPLNSKISEVKKKKIPPSVRRIVWETYIGDVEEGKCQCCNLKTLKREDAWHCGHVIAESCGGPTELLNLRPMCPECNLQMGKKEMTEYQRFKGFVVTENMPKIESKLNDAVVNAIQAAEIVEEAEEEIKQLQEAEVACVAEVDEVACVAEVDEVACVAEVDEVACVAEVEEVACVAEVADEVAGVAEDS